MVTSIVNHVIRGLKLSVPLPTLQGVRLGYWLKTPFNISKAILLVMNILVYGFCFVFVCIFFLIWENVYFSFIF